MVKQFFAYLKLFHGGYNALSAMLFFYQGWLGLRIRRARRAKRALPLATIKRHRKIGSVLRALVLLGFLFGVALALANEKVLFAHPVHFAVGLSIVLLVFTTALVSKRIKGPDSLPRKTHFVLGISILTLFLMQIFLGLGLLL